MIRSVKIILIITAVVIVGGATIFGIVVFANWGVYQYSNTYYYEQVPSPEEKLILNCDIGAINIRYNTTPTDYIVKLDLDIRIEGGFVAGKSFSDFFYPVQWVNNTSPITTFNLLSKPTVFLIFGIIKIISIDVTLRTDIFYDINAFTSTGSIDMAVPQNVILNNTVLTTSTGAILLNAGKNAEFLGNIAMTTSTGSIASYVNQVNLTHGINTQTSTGSLTMNFTNCVIGGDIIGDVSTGSVTLTSYNTIYTKNSVWDVRTATGSINVQMRQYIEMEANITGIIETSTGSIDILYDDSLSTIGARFTCTTGTGSIEYTDLGSGGMSRVNGIISTNDYNSAANKYSLTVSASTGSIEVLGQSL